MTMWLVSHPAVTFIIIYVLMTFVYNKVFKMRKLPLLKDLIIYLLIGVGALLLLTFQVFMQLPIVYCLTVAVALMLMVRIRYFVEKRQRKS